MIQFERVSAPDVPWADLDAAPDRTHCQTRGWLDFLAETQGAEPVVARVLDGSRPIGWFTGAIVRRAGLKILGSPMRGWTTSAMGFNLAPGADRSAALAGLPRFAFKTLGCIHLEVSDRNLASDRDVPDGFRSTRIDGYELELATDDELLANMTKSGRRNIRTGRRNGIVVEAIDPLQPGDFAEVFYDQVSEAFAKRGLAPTYPVDRVHALIRHLGPTGTMLLMRALTPDGTPAATRISFGLPGRAAESFLGASYRSSQSLYPNEILMWATMQEWRERGAVQFGFGGGGAYKAKYGGVPHALPWLRMSRFETLEVVRTAALRLHRRRQWLDRRHRGP